ncbi:peroxisome membrane protein [Corynascus novoguineensis]|uniref:Peroxisomal membrane protein PEX16 n=1 Tax=Corynascus novoguineensis TaxID=1126955 RepID=A0AAN7CRE8_9PEZI|nr:peroxisome membrane protein [Corynascus novoguineensis]
MYDDFITKNAHQVSQIESTLRSLTYIIPGRFRDAEIASESIHSGVQLLSLYHDTLLRRAQKLTRLPLPPSLAAHPPSPRSRYTRFWTLRSALYRRVAYVLQVVQYVELLCEMAAKRRGERARWRVVVLLEAVKAACRLLLMRITRSRPLVTPVLPEREPIPEEPPGEEEEEERDDAEPGEDDEDRGDGRRTIANGDAESVAASYANGSAEDGNLHKCSPSPSSPQQQQQQQQQKQLGPNGEWTMSRTGMSLPSLPAPGDTGGYLLSRVLTADDIKPAPKLLNRLHGQAQAAEVLHILAPLIFATALALTQTNNKGDGDRARRRAWLPWLLGVGAELAARQLRDRGLRTTPLEREEWSRRGWAMGWWALRGAFYEHVTKGIVEGVRRRMPGLLAGILEDYEYLWENYYFSTSS